MSLDPITGAAATDPAPLLTEASKENLLAPCSQLKPNPCTQISSFHGAFTPDGSKIIFAYR